MNEQQLIALAAQGDDYSIIRLADQYLPVVLKLRRQYFIRNFDDDDWLQEARIAIHRAAQQYDVAQPCSFGSFYRLLLNNQIIDLIRRSQAKKRRPEQEVLSLDDEEEDVLSDALVTTLSAVDVVYVHDRLSEFGQLCSQFEGQVFAAMLTGMTPQGIATMLQVELAPVTNAADRCRRKLRLLLRSQA
ncbi:sigma-70 family RNA polymerase sigma factor [Lactiplantibacillus garii]|uniref:Sigma-70 family RNA polymerase sigma factor n=1 Tax=Lactiplantibacillus garii TaxID=2306423 RepID=A0A3R8JAA8_9LACO|nr:sigma-70 family RNA polymerase sigma factor [Lactiplantibacillus garii]RRK11854.1 sigma-70 family RNA polymerase sigma factor [Lactiplantibacillus garii]